MPEQSWKGERGTPAERGYDSKWVKLRNNYIKHNPLCEARGPACKGAARIVHHVIPIEKRPDLRLVRSNLMAVCDPCHRQAHDELVPGTVVAVCGAPGSGKAEYIRQHMGSTDLIWDWDAILEAMGYSYEEHMRAGIRWLLHDWRSSLVARVRRGTICRTVWVSVVNYGAACRLGDQLLVMDRSKLASINQLESREIEQSKLRGLIQLVHDWDKEFSIHRGFSGPPPVQPGGGIQSTTAQKTLFRAENEDANGLEKHSVDILQRIARAETSSWGSDPGERG
jgi:hypothetical protein